MTSRICDICYKETEDVINCFNGCTNVICIQCFMDLKKQECPFCRVSYKKRKHTTMIVGEGEKKIITDKYEYVGQVDDNGKPHGYGRKKFKDGRNYVGEFLNGNIQGKGTIQYANEDVYTGDFVDNKKHGEGIYEWKTRGSVYTGTWKDGKRSYGTLKYRNGVVFEGEFVFNEETTETTMFGKMTYTNGDVIYGQFKNSSIVFGFASKLCSNGTLYRGEINEDGKYHGYGVMYYADGGYYTGQFEFGRRHGKGTYRHHNGDVYIGEYKDDEEHGHGKTIYKDLGFHIGEYYDGERGGNGKIVTKEMIIINGNWRNDIVHGNCKIYVNGKTLICNAENGAINITDYLLEQLAEIV